MHVTTMNRKHMVPVFLALALVALAACLPLGFTAVSVGVKKGDWAEYNVSITGTQPPGHNLVWARMEITDVQGANITIKIDTKDDAGAEATSNATLDLENGYLIDEFIIPANLNVGDRFLDNPSSSTISGTVDKVVAGATRTLVYVAAQNKTTYWDKSTGMLVEGTYEGFYANAVSTEATRLSATNIWQPDNTIYVLLAIAAVLAGIAVVVFAVRRSKKADSTTPNTKNPVTENAKPAQDWLNIAFFI